MESQILQRSILLKTYCSVEIMQVCSTGLGALSAMEAKEYFSRLQVFNTDISHTRTPAGSFKNYQQAPAIRAETAVLHYNFKKAF